MTLMFGLGLGVQVGPPQDCSAAAASDAGRQCFWAVKNFFEESLSLRKTMAILEMLAQSLAPTACTTIEEVGSTGVGALTVAFLVLAITTIIFIARSAVPGLCTRQSSDSSANHRRIS